MNEKIKEMVECIGEIGVGVVKVGIGVFIGNLVLVVDGVSYLMLKYDKVLNLVKDYFIDDNG